MDQVYSVEKAYILRPMAQVFAKIVRSFYLISLSLSLSLDYPAISSALREISGFTAWQQRLLLGAKSKFFLLGRNLIY